MKKKRCPRIGKPCIQQECAFYMEFSNRNTQTGETKTWFECADTAKVGQNAVIIQQNERIEASIQDLRNKTIDRQDKAMGIFNLMRSKDKGLING